MSDTTTKTSNWKISYEAKLITSLTLAVILPLFVFAFISLHSVTDAMTKSIAHDLQKSSIFAAHHINDFISERLIDAKVLSQADVLESNNIPKIIQYLTETVKENQWVNDIDVLDGSGVVIASSGIQNEKNQYIGKLYSGSEALFLKTQQAKQGQVFVSEALKLDTGYGLLIMTPITDDTNSIVIGAIATEVNLDSISKIVSVLSKGIIGNKYVYIVDNDGKVIVTDNPDTSIFESFPDLSVQPQLLEAFANQGDTGHIIYIDSHKDNVMAGYADMAEFGENQALDWSIIAIAPLEDIMADATQLRWMLTGFGLIIGLVALIIAFIYALKQKRELTLLSNHAEQIYQGDYSKRLPELGANKGAFINFIQTFNRMTNKVESTLLNLSHQEKILKNSNQQLEQKNIILKKSEKALEESNYNLQQYLDVIDKINIGLFVVDDDYRVRYMNNTMISWFGNQTDEICYSSVAKLDKACSYCKLKEVIAENKKVIYEPETPDGQSFNIVATSIKNSDGTSSKMEVIRNITDTKNAQKYLLLQKEKLAHQAHHDFLTGLPNRLLFNDRLEKSIEKSKRNNTKIALLYIDLDHFKEINDSLGHNIGDEVLKIVTQRLNDIIRKEDTLARLGGDEFTIILEELTQGQNASLLAQKIINSLAKALIIENNNFYVTSSIGISLYPDDGVNAQDLLKYADSAMYKAKSEGRNNFQFYSAEMTELAFERVVMESSFREALINEDFLVYYQPQINAKENKLIGMEALVRWQHSTMGLVSPAKFIPLAETTGLIIELDQFVMKTAMKQISLWYSKGLNPGVLALNLAIKQLQQRDFISILGNLLKETQCKPQWVELEVTEGQIMTNPEEAVKILKQISDMGIELAVDDFGTGYSSLSYLKKLPLNKLKIDQSFVRELPDDEEDSAITKSVIALAQSLNLNIIAEGVETKEQEEFLVNNGCDNIQGFFYSRPITADEMEKYLKK